MTPGKVYGSPQFEKCFPNISFRLIYLIREIFLSIFFSMYEKEFLVWIKHLKAMIISVEKVGAKIHLSIVIYKCRLN